MSAEMSNIHATAIIDAGAELDSSVTVGPYTVIGPHVKIGAGTTIGAHCVLEGHTTIGKDNRIFQFNSLGAIPQDKKYNGEPCELHIGDRNTIREFCTFNRGTAQDEGTTRIGDDNWIMAYVHIAHDCQLGNHVLLVNNATLAGHVTTVVDGRRRTVEPEPGGHAEPVGPDRAVRRAVLVGPLVAWLVAGCIGLVRGDYFAGVTTGALAGCELIEVDYEELKPVMDITTVESAGSAQGRWYALNEAVLEKVHTGRLARLERGEHRAHLLALNMLSVKAIA